VSIVIVIAMRIVIRIVI